MSGDPTMGGRQPQRDYMSGDPSMGEFRESVSGDPTMGGCQPQRECVW